MVDKPNTKIAVSDIDKLEELLDLAPAHRDMVVSKRQAIGRLAPKLYAMRAKGYSWNAVALWLTEHGLAVTAALLNGYLRRAPSDNPRTGGRPRRAEPQRLPVTPVVASSAAQDVDRPPAPSAAAERIGAATHAAGKQANGRRAEPPVRRPEFAIRPDSDEI